MPVEVSIITPVYNSSRFVAETIESVLKQTHNKWELWLVDDCSTDRSLEIIKNFAMKDKRIKIIGLPENSGAAVARNMAIEAAQGRYIAFLDSDDIWLPHKVETQITWMQEHDIAFSYSAYQKISESGIVLEHMGIPEAVNYKELLKTCVIGCVTAVYDVKKLGKIYMPTHTKREDFATWLNILKRIDYAYGISETLAQYRIYSDQSSGKKFKMAKENWHLYRKLEKLNLIQSCYYFTHYAIRGTLRTYFPQMARLLKLL